MPSLELRSEFCPMSFFRQMRNERRLAVVASNWRGWTWGSWVKVKGHWGCSWKRDKNCKQIAERCKNFIQHSKKSNWTWIFITFWKMIQTHLFLFSLICIYLSNLVSQPWISENWLTLVTCLIYHFKSSNFELRIICLLLNKLRITILKTGIKGLRNIVDLALFAKATWR